MRGRRASRGDARAASQAFERTHNTLSHMVNTWAPGGVRPQFRRFGSAESTSIRASACSHRRNGKNALTRFPRQRNNACDNQRTREHHVLLGRNCNEDVTHRSDGRNRHCESLPHARVHIVVVVTQLADCAAAVLAFKLRYRLQVGRKLKRNPTQRTCQKKSKQPLRVSSRCAALRVSANPNKK